MKIPAILLNLIKKLTQIKPVSITNRRRIQIYQVIRTLISKFVNK